ncbi:YueI family protein [Fervidibacillus halotolerans]|uniref:YueI family protein n=1 Tax=Fervidibacillus halotolerans TaxID=2980027 RepID=A0A9E8LZD8_9BACI|nr:YueI family protein [Fervidibacillus halotolerans]WAA12608.1 YueI family protein [Fervidibacillus halotolerans]
MGKSGPNLDDYLKKGMYGVKSIKADERQRFLGTIRERIIIALFKEQIYESGVYPEVEQAMKNHPKARLLLNGKISYEYLSKYMKLANKRNIPFTVVQDLVDDTDIGLVLTYDYAINKEHIFIEKKEKQPKAPPTGNGEGETGIKSFFKKWFK